MKPTFGLGLYTDSGSNKPTDDHLGPMTPTVAENALLLEAIAGYDNDEINIYEIALAWERANDWRKT